MSNFENDLKKHADRIINELGEFNINCADFTPNNITARYNYKDHGEEQLKSLIYNNFSREDLSYVEIIVKIMLGINHCHIFYDGNKRARVAFYFMNIEDVYNIKYTEEEVADYILRYLQKDITEEEVTRVLSTPKIDGTVLRELEAKYAI